MQRMLTEKAMADAVGKMDMMKGDKPTTEELLEIIIPLIPEPVKGDKGDKGDDYVLTQKDKQEIASSITVPIVEKVIVEKTEVIKEQPIVTEIVREVALTDTANQLRDKLESLKKGEKLTIYAIEDLADLLEELKKWRGEVGTFMSMGGGGGFTSPVYNFVDDEVLTGTIDGNNTIFTINRLPYRGSVKIYRGGSRQRVGEDYTLNSTQKQITFLIVPQVGEILLADYRTS